MRANVLSIFDGTTIWSKQTAKKSLARSSLRRSERYLVRSRALARLRLQRSLVSKRRACRSLRDWPDVESKP